MFNLLYSCSLLVGLVFVGLSFLVSLVSFVAPIDLDTNVEPDVEVNAHQLDTVAEVPTAPKATVEVRANGGAVPGWRAPAPA